MNRKLSEALFNGEVYPVRRYWHIGQPKGSTWNTKSLGDPVSRPESRDKTRGALIDTSQATHCI